MKEYKEYKWSLPVQYCFFKCMAALGYLGFGLGVYHQFTEVPDSYDQGFWVIIEFIGLVTFIGSEILKGHLEKDHSILELIPWIR